MSPTYSVAPPAQKAGAAQQHSGQNLQDKSITSTSITLYKGRVIVMGSWRLINISCFENKLLGLALTLIYHQEPIILRPMFCSIDLLDFFLPQDHNIIAFLQAALPLIAAPYTHIPLQEAQDRVRLGWDGESGRQGLLGD